MTARSELGISPVLLQAIAQTLTSSSLTSPRETPTTSSFKVAANSNSLSAEVQTQGKVKMEGSSDSPSSARVVSHLLQNLNEPVASLMSRVSTTSQGIPDDNNCAITQAGLSMLGITDSDVAVSSRSNTGQNSSSKNLQQVMSNEEISNFLLKEEPTDDPEMSPTQSSSQNMNTVSSMLTALASHHMQESLIKKSSKQSQSLSQQQHQNSDTTIDSNYASVSDTRSQPQIIIYSYINNNNQEVVPSPQGNDIVVNEGDVSTDMQTTYRVLLQPSDDGGESKQVTFPPDLNYQFSSGSNIVPVTDAHNTQDGMRQPCPVCGDKVSGYHYGIFTCESCKGFFKRTVQNKKAFVCPKSSDCSINSLTRKKCPACRFKRCLNMGMKLEAIRHDRLRGGRSSYEGCAAHLKNRVTPLEKKMKRVTSRLPGEDIAGPSQEVEDGAKSHRNLVAILNHNMHKQTTPNSGKPHIPELLRDIMNLEPLLSDDDLPAESIMEAPFPEQALYSYMMQLAELRLYKLVRWARNLPQFGAISTDDQILLLQNCWSELIALSLCWRSIDTPNQISISSTHHITAEWAQHLGFEDVVIRLLSITENFRKLYMDQFEYVALKVLLLITPDVKGLKEPRKIRDFQDKLLEALLAYTTSHYQNMKHKFGELLLRLPELSRISFMSKDILIKSLPSSMASCGLLVELLKGDNKGDGEGTGLRL